MAGKNRLMARLVATSATITPDSDYIATNLTKTQPTAVALDVYSSIDSLPASAETGTKALVTGNNTLYIYNNGWYKIAIINNFNPQWITQPNSTYDLAINGAATSITVVASDSDDVPITYIATPDSDFLTFATVTHDSDKDNTWIIQPVDSENGAATGGTGTVTFKASDGVNLVQALSTFSLTFGPNWSVAPTETKLTSSDIQAGDNFGTDVSISSDGNYAIVGAYAEDAGGSDAGAAYVFTRSGSSWTQQAKLVASDAGVDNWYGDSVAISSDGTYAIVGADKANANKGAAYIYTRSGSTWTQQARIVASDAAVSDGFGAHVSISSDGDYVIVGKANDNSYAGAAYIFTRSGSTWTQQAKITASDAQASDYFGYGVKISSDSIYAIVGAPFEDAGGSSAGAAYIFSRSGSTWTQQAKLVVSDAQASDFAGWDSSINSDGTYAVVGVRREDGGAGDPIADAGAAYIFTRDSDTWTEQQKLTASDAQSSDEFGYSVYMSDDGSYVVVGATDEDGGVGDPLSSAGAAYVFERDGSTWTEVRKITTSDALADNRISAKVSINSDGSYVIIGAQYTDGGSGNINNNSGAAYIYEAG